MIINADAPSESVPVDAVLAVDEVEVGDSGWSVGGRVNDESMDSVVDERLLGARVEPLLLLLLLLGGPAPASANAARSATLNSLPPSNEAPIESRPKIEPWPGWRVLLLLLLLLATVAVLLWRCGRGELGNISLPDSVRLVRRLPVMAWAVRLVVPVAESELRLLPPFERTRPLRRRAAREGGVGGRTKAAG